MDKSTRNFYFLAFVLLFTLSAYPLVMGMKIVVLYLLHGSIHPEDYARYVIPYTAISLSVLISVALYPALSKLKRLSNLIVVLMGLAMFVIFELSMEGITINSPLAKSTVEWQLFSCIGTPTAVQAFKNGYSNAFKIHYFLVSFVLIALIINTFYNYAKSIAGGYQSSGSVLRIQLAATMLLLALCIFANITGFFRGTGQYLSSWSALLTGIFFIVLGFSFGIYVGSFLIKHKNTFLSIGIPTLSSILVCIIMYYGEYMMMDGQLYRFGTSLFMQGLPYIVVSPADILIIISSGLITATLMIHVRKGYTPLIDTRVKASI